MNKVEIMLGAELFRFTDMNDWIESAQKKFRSTGVTADDVLCIDTMGRVCDCGKQFKRALEENTYPIRCYEKTL